MGKRDTVGSSRANPEKLFVSDVMAAATRSPEGFRGAMGLGMVSSVTSVATGKASVGCIYPSVTCLLDFPKSPIVSINFWMLVSLAIEVPRSDDWF